MICSQDKIDKPCQMQHLNVGSTFIYSSFQKKTRVVKNEFKVNGSVL